MLHRLRVLLRTCDVPQVAQELVRTRHLRALDLRGTANALWGMARLGHNPGAGWVDLVLGRMAPGVAAAQGRWGLGVCAVCVCAVCVPCVWAWCWGGWRPGWRRRRRAGGGTGVGVCAVCARCMCVYCVCHKCAGP